MRGAETLVFDDLTPFLLLKNGNFLYKIPFRGGFAVVKVYHGSRSRSETWRKSAENLIVGQSSYQPETRMRVERECLEVWRKHGFRVYDIYDGVGIDAPQCRPGGYLVFEYRRGPSLNEHLSDESQSLEARFDTFRRFLREWGRRHALALEHRETRLVHENGDGKHVMIFDDGFLWLDFEVIWTRTARIADHVSHEIIQYLWQISKSIPEALRGRLLTEAALHYPDPDRLREAWRMFLANRRPLVRAARAIDRRTSRGRKPTSKYAVAERLRRALEAR